MTKTKSENFAKLSSCAMGMSIGVLWALSMFVCAIVANCFDWGQHFIKVMASVYVGFGTDIMGALIGMAWGFADGFIGGFIFACLYNFFTGCSKCCHCICKCK